MDLHHKLAQAGLLGITDGPDVRGAWSTALSRGKRIDYEPNERGGWDWTLRSGNQVKGSSHVATDEAMVALVLKEARAAGIR